MREKEAYSIAKPYTPSGAGGVNPPAETENRQKMKKTLTALLLCAFYLNSASAKIEYSDTKVLTVTESESMNSILQWQEEHPGSSYYVDMILLHEATLNMDNFRLPISSYFCFENATLNFNSIQQIEYGQMPQLFVGNMLTWGEGNLTISLTDAAMKGMLEDQDLSVKVEQCLLPYTYFNEIGDSQAFFVLHDAEGNAISKGQTYSYKEQNYTNVGIIYNVSQLNKNEIALLFTGGLDPDGWGMGSFSVVALGESYIPVPEPASGTLSLLALAGLCARRRRK